MTARRIGLTGGIASGKSAVSARLREQGVVIIDADAIARDVMATGGEGLAEATAEFGEEILCADGSLNRPALGRLVFDDDDARERLNAIVHPRVRAEAARQRRAAGQGKIVVEDIPLLVETGQQDRFDAVVVVTAPEEERIRRMVSDRRMSREEALSRIRAQASDAQREAAADAVLHNDTTLEDLHRQVDELLLSWRSWVNRAGGSTAGWSPAQEA